MIITKYHLVICAIFTTSVTGFRLNRFSGDACQIGMRDGICKALSDCQPAFDAIKKGIYPDPTTLCSYNGSLAIVCCLETERTTPTTITEPINRIKQDKDDSRRKADEMCGCYHNYEDPGVHQCGYDGLESRLNFEDVVDPRIVGGVLAGSREFPHMVALGYDNADGNIDWQCGGSLISSKHVLTAAHCLQNKGGIVKHVRIGDVNMGEVNASLTRQNFEVANYFRHPNYTKRSIYDDIAILVLNNSVQFSEYARPACLSTELVSAPSPCVATGWGIDSWQATVGSSDLKKADLQVRPPVLCSMTYNSDRRNLPRGVLEQSMICAGDPAEKRDTCNGDSGGPLQVESSTFTGMFDIIGVTSFGTQCTDTTSPAIYTRVYNYVPWIVNIVWSRTPDVDTAEENNANLV